MKKDQRVVFVTGASRGIGKAIVEKFQSQGWQTAACAAHAKESGADLHLVCDVADAAAVRASIETIMKTFGRLDAVINNAGVALDNSLDPDVNDDMWHRVIEVNLHGTYYVSKYALPHLPDHEGRIVNIASVLGLKAVPAATAYCAAKHGVVGFTKALALDTAQRGITVNAICPGWVRTDMARERMEAIGFDPKNIAKTVPLGKMIEPQEIADLAYYLVNSAASANITGQTFTIDGGVLA
jgi:NAD(P)-dependent dehydrogenase (short-subunit alcohol dehydrogenase family)